jgi:hypothetical protein
MDTHDQMLAPGRRAPTLPHLLHRIAGHRAMAVRIMAEIDATTRRMNMLLARRVAGDLIDDIEDRIMELRGRLMSNDVRLMAAVAEARAVNEHRPETRRIDLDMAFRAMPGDRQPAAA